MCNALHIDSATSKIKQARHVAFDEGMTDSANLPPFIQYLQDPESNLELVDLEDMATLDASLSPFAHVSDITCEFRPQDEYSLGVQYGPCPQYLRAYASDFLRPFGPHSVDSACRKFLGGYITKIGDTPVFSVDDVNAALHALAHSSSPPSTVVVRIS